MKQRNRKLKTNQNSFERNTHRSEEKEREDWPPALRRAMDYDKAADWSRKMIHKRAERQIENEVCLWITKPWTFCWTIYSGRERMGDPVGSGQLLLGLQRGITWLVLVWYFLVSRYSDGSTMWRMRYLKLGNLQPKILFKLFFILYWTFIFGLGHTINKGKGYFRSIC